MTEVWILYVTWNELSPGPANCEYIVPLNVDPKKWLEDCFRPGWWDIEFACLCYEKV